MSFALYAYIFLAAFRERIIPFVLLAFGLVTLLSYAFGAAAFVEKQQFIVVFAAFSLRLVSVASLILFSVFFIRRSFEMQEVTFLISGAMGRVQLILTYALALSSIAVLIGLGAGAVVFAIMPERLETGYSLWLSSMVLENIIVVIVSLFFGGALRSAPQAILAVLGFYILARVNGHLLGIIDSGTADGNPVIDMAGYVMEFILSLIPRLDLMGQGGWLLYGDEGTFAPYLMVMQAAVFCFLLLSASVIDFLRKQF